MINGKLPNLQTQERIADAMELIAEYISQGRDRSPVILGVIGLDTSSPELIRVNGSGSYDIEVTEKEVGDFVEMHWDDTKWPYSLVKETLTANGHVISFPKAYRKAVENVEGVIAELYFSDTELTGFERYGTLFMDQYKNTENPNMFTGAYNASNVGGKLVSRSGLEPQVSTTLATSRARARANNVGGVRGYQLLDFWTQLYLKDLYLITFANKNSDTIFPQGAEGTRQVNGMLDGMEHHTGYTKGLDNYLMKFLGIENFFSNVYTQVDGIKIVDRDVYVCDNPDLYNSDENTDNYYKIGTVPSNDGWIKGINKYLIPVTTGGSASTYYGDYLYQNQDYRTLYFGRHWDVNSNIGLFSWHGYPTLDYTRSYIGVRLVKKATS